jgi:hypothetical protein
MTGPGATIVPDTITALFTVASAAPALTGVAVSDGPRISDDTEFNRLFIGMDVLSGSDVGAEGLDDYGFAPGIVTLNQFSVICVAESWSGDIEDVSVCRSTAWMIREAVRSLLIPDPTTNRILGLSGLDRAALGAWQLAPPRQTAQGVSIDCQFRVEFVANPFMVEP